MKINLLCLVMLGSTSFAATPAQQAYVKATHRCGNYEYFGDAVAVSWDTMVIGANFDANGASGVNPAQNDCSVDGAGAAYVFVRSGTNSVERAYLKASNNRPGDGWVFGVAVAISGDTIVVGARDEASTARLRLLRTATAP